MFGVGFVDIIGEDMSIPKSDFRVYIYDAYRSEISHTYAYLFKKSKRSIKHRSGLDYTKIVIINKSEYVDNIDALVDKDEYNVSHRKR